MTTIAQVKAELAAMARPMVISRECEDEYRVTFNRSCFIGPSAARRNRAEALAHYTPDLDDALSTARHMQATCVL